MSDCYGKARMAKIRAAVNDLRAVIRAHGTPEIETAWDRLEPWIDAPIWKAQEAE